MEFSLVIWVFCVYALTYGSSYMAINHSDRCWWRTFCDDVRRAFRRNDLEMKAYLYEAYERHMHKRLMREYQYYKQIEYNELKAKGLIDKRLGYYDWLNDSCY